jgi:hypothetical protein
MIAATLPGHRLPNALLRCKKAVVRLWLGAYITTTRGRDV